MERFQNWLRSLTLREKLMLALVVLLVVCVALRWGWIKNEVTRDTRERFQQEATDPNLGE